MRISAIIVNYNSGLLLDKCVRSLAINFRHNIDEIVIVDNNSSDNSFELIRNKGLVKCIGLKENFGYGYGCNVGSAMATGDILLFLNPDVVINTPLESVINIFEKYDKCAIVSPLVIDENDHQDPANTCWAFPGLMSSIIEEISTKRRVAKKHMIDGDIFFTGFSTGCALFVRKKTFDELGGFDDKYFLYYEEVDLFKQLYDAGHQFVYQPQCKITHIGSGSSNSLNWKQTAIRYNSKLRYYTKHYGPIHQGVFRLLSLIIIILKITITLIGAFTGVMDSRKIRAYIYAIRLHVFGYKPWPSD